MKAKKKPAAPAMEPVPTVTRDGKTLLRYRLPPGLIYEPPRYLPEIGHYTGGSCGEFVADLIEDV